MKISIQDRSNYLKGLLIVAKKDNQLAAQEKKIITFCGEKLGFASDFVEDALRDLLANEYISEEPIIFSDVKIAEQFIVAGLELVHSDNAVAGNEIDWLKSVAIANKLSESWFYDKLKSLKDSEMTICSD